MELVKNIFFDTDKIVENSEIKVTYAGFLFQNGSQDVIAHLGYGEDWENSQDITMEKTALGFQAIINVESAEKLNLCFRNSNGEWDNNNGNNYRFAIEKQDLEEANIEVEKEKKETIDVPIAVYKTPSWGELIKKTFNNFINYITKLFGKNVENTNND
ncbi:MAG: hypothetical protein J6J36_07700 [Clostridia bacterium]|nr:hypothetical protein [Clostridia bacterium]